MGGFRADAAPAGVAVRAVRASIAVSVVATAMAAAGCSFSSPEMDLSQNERLYRHTGYTSQVPGDRTAFLPPLVDDRGARIEDASADFSTEYFADGRWDRPPTQMVDAVLREELAGSDIFGEVTETARENGCIVRTRLIRFDVGTESHVAGIRSFAAVTIGVEVLGPMVAGGVRPTWLSEEFVGAHRSELDWRPAPASLLMGASLRDAMVRLLARLDQSNVGRTGVPLEVR
jgi:hypothetical protein